MDGFDDQTMGDNRQWEVSGSCSTVMFGKMWIFGGGSWSVFRRQVLSVDNCQLKNEGILPFEFTSGACNTVDQSNGAQSALLFWPKRLVPGTKCSSLFLYLSGWA